MPASTVAPAAGRTGPGHDRPGHYNDGRVRTGAAPPTEEQCADQIATRATDHIPLDVGTRVCYRTEGGRVVYFEVTGLVEEGGSLSTPRYELDVVVWRRQAAGKQVDRHRRRGQSAGMTHSARSPD